MLDVKKTLKEAEEQFGVKFYQLCGFDKQLVPVVDSAGLSSDGIINVGSASFGTQDPAAGSGSTDSGCVFPERTWFFKGQQHDDIAYNDAALSLVKDILTGEVSGVDSSEKYPQVNGCRNTRTLKYTLVPQARTFVSESDLPDNIRADLNACLEAYDELRNNVSALDQDAVRALESKFKAALDALRKEE